MGSGMSEVEAARDAGQLHRNRARAGIDRGWDTRPRTKVDELVAAFAGDHSLRRFCRVSVENGLAGLVEVEDDAKIAKGDRANHQGTAFGEEVRRFGFVGRERHGHGDGPGGWRSLRSSRE